MAYISLLCFGTTFLMLNLSFSYTMIQAKHVSMMSDVINIDDVCLSNECKEESNKILKNVDYDTKPCDDFYEFSCGNFIKNTDIPEDKPLQFSNNDTEEFLNDLHSCIKEDISSSDQKPFQLVKIFYQSCMNTLEIEKLGFEPLLTVLRRLGEWPVISNRWEEKNFNWIKVVNKSRKIGYSGNYIIGFSVETDQKNTSRRIINLDSASTGLEKVYLIKGMQNENVKAYYEYMVDVATLLYGTNDNELKRIRKELQDVLDFEIKLAKISLSSDDLVNVTLQYNPTTISELSTRYPNFPWLMYINTMLNGHHQVNNDEVINIVDTKFFEQLENVLNDTTSRTKANYLLWRVVFDSVFFLNDALREKQLNYLSKILGINKREPRWKECVSVVIDNIKLGTSAMYVKEFFNTETQDKVKEMVYNIRDQFSITIEKNDWMDERTRDFARKKLKAMNFIVGYPEELLDNNKLKKYYSKFHALKSNEYFKNILKLKKHSQTFNLLELRKPVEKKDWVLFGKAADINAYYEVNKNAIFLPAGVLRGSFFNESRPDSINYGSLGFVIGHEMTHAFDSIGRKFDENGMLNNWWTNETNDLFEEKAQCVTDLFNNFTEKATKKQLNGVRTLGENIADISGYKHAFFAFNEKIKNDSQASNLINQKLFWISAANTWCAKIRNETLQFIIDSDEHSPAAFRVNGPLSTLNEFSKIFDCKPDSQINLKNKCLVW